MSVAHLLDPRYYGKKLSANSMSTILTFIQKYYPNEADIIWRQLLQYKTQTGVFSLDFAWNAVDEVDPIAWWEGNFKESASEQCKVASRILNIPSSSAAAERNWSNFSYIHDKKRSRLTLPRVLKLVYIYSNYKLTRPKSESKDLIEAVLCFNSRPSDEINKFELLDPDSDEYEELVESNSENETVELSESEIESATESDIDDESE
ncbi:10712_t:CDS:1 [Gigaspora rosea]|nr:10712_t:CDS:1 [Gigaspora rosea]